MGSVLLFSLLAAALITPPSPVGAVQVDSTLYQFFLGLAAVMVLVIGYLATRTLRQVDASQERTTQIQDRLFEKLDTLCEEFYTMKGEHKARVCEKGKDKS